MATKTNKTPKTGEKLKFDVPEDLVRERAYLKWLSVTNGEVTDEDFAVRVWLEAEKELIEELGKE